MADQPEDLLQRLERLGQDGVGNYGMPICAEAAAELRRLHAVNAELLAALRLIAATDPVDAALDPQRAVRVARAAIAKAEGGPK
jgi:hypothetical protein